MMFDYNTTRSSLLYSEYGRNIQNMVKFIKTLESKDERNKHAQAVIDLMGFLNPHLRDVADFKHKLWDHLFIIADFDLDVDSPYPIPSKESLDTKPNRVPYPSNRIRYKHYGKTVELMIERAKQITDEPERKSNMVASIANFMKMSYVTWNKDSVSDESIINDLKTLSNGELVLDENVNLNKVEVRATPNKARQNNNFKQRNNNNNNNRNSNNKNNNRNTGKSRY
ncbi:MAG: DUF4290 domain-containing protein [Sphingobacteriales bacterium]|nr:DUF4290 domain-containing protein [Sphingobacteriales bacterium]